MWQSQHCKSLLAFLTLGLFAVGCAGGAKDDPAGGGLSGKVELDGSSTVYPISEGIAEGFEKDNPGIKVTVAQSGTGGGFKRFTKGETDISAASRPITAEEQKACEENNIEYIELPIAYDGLTVVVNKENDFVEQLTVDDLKKIYLAESAAKTWKDVNSEWPDLAIKVFSPGTDSGTFDYFHEVLDKKKDMRGDMSTSEDDNQLVTGVAGEKGAIGFFGASYYFTNKDKLKAVAIVNQGKAVLPTPETIESGEYAPFSRPLFIYVNLASAKRPEVKKFVAYYLKNAADMASKVQYVALPEEIGKRGLEHFENRLSGSHYLDEEGNKRSGSLDKVYVKENLPQAKAE